MVAVFAVVEIRPLEPRNALFLLAHIEAERGDWTAAECLCRTAARHRFQTQGGDGLLLWATALEHVGMPEEARRALELLVERDPESAAATGRVAEVPRPAARGAPAPGRSRALE